MDFLIGELSLRIGVKVPTIRLWPGSRMSGHRDLSRQRPCSWPLGQAVGLYAETEKNESERTALIGSAEQPLCHPYARGLRPCRWLSRDFDL